MQELVKTTSEISAIITDTLTAIRDNIKIVVAEIATESAVLVKVISLITSSNIIGLLDDIFDFYPYEWVIVNRSIQALDSRIDRLIYERVLFIGEVLYNFSVITDALIRDLEDKLSLIDNVVSTQYNKRMFAIYGRIAEFSIAINAPPSYLEEAIQNARFFAMGISASMGLSYYQFISDWDSGVERLLIRISNSISLYQQNPQWIKLDIEESLIRPVYDLKINSRDREKEQASYLRKTVTNLEGSVTAYELRISENKQAIMNLYTSKIEPALKEIEETFDSWEKDKYDIKMKLIDKSFTSLFMMIVGAINEARKVLGLLDYGGDLLLRVNKLSDILRIEQEDKIADVTTRSYRRLVPEWLSEVKEKTG